MFLPVTGKVDGNVKNTIIHNVYTIAKTLMAGPQRPGFHSPNCRSALSEYLAYSIQLIAIAYDVYSAIDERAVIAPNAT